MSRDRKNKYRIIADKVKALAHATRLMIIDLLLEKSRCVGDIEKELDLKQTNVSQHLNILKSSGMVDFEVKGRQRCYYIKDKAKVLKMLNCMSDEIERRRNDGES